MYSQPLQPIWVFLCFMFFPPICFADSISVPKEKWPELLSEGIQAIRELKTAYSTVSMNGTTELLMPRQEIPVITSFEYARVDDEYCRIDNIVNKKSANGSSPRSVHRLITPKAGYLFWGEDSGFKLQEKQEWKAGFQPPQAILEAVGFNWKVGSAPFITYGNEREKELALPHSPEEAKVSGAVRGGWIKQIREDTIDGQRIVFVESEYYFNTATASGMASYYRDYLWALRDYVADSMNGNKLVGHVKAYNEYDFSEKVPRLKKTIFETVDIDGKRTDFNISKIEIISFAVPEMSLFDVKQFLPPDAHSDSLMRPAQFSWGRIFFISFGLVLIVLGLWRKFSCKALQS